MKKLFSGIILIALTFSLIGCTLIRNTNEDESTPLPAPTDGFSIKVGEQKDGMFTCRGASEGAVVISSDESIAEVTAYKVEGVGSVSYKIVGKKAGKVTVLVRSGIEGVTLDSHTYTVS